MARYPAIPRIPGAKADMRAVIEAVETLTGVRSRANRRALTAEDMMAAGFRFNIRGSTDGRVGVLSLPEFVEELPPELPTTPAGLVADGAFTGINISWESATYRGHAHTVVYRSLTDDFDSAVDIGTSVGNLFTDTVDPGSTYFYWIRFVNTDDDVGSLNDTEGTEGSTRRLVSDIIEATNDQFSEVLLDENFRNKISGIQDSVGSTARRISDEVDARLVADNDFEILRLIRDAAIDTTSEARALINGVGIIDESTTRQSADESFASQLNAVVATSGGRWYIEPSTGTPPQDHGPTIDFTGTRHWIDTVDSSNRRYATARTGTADPDVPANYEWVYVGDLRIDSLITSVSEEETARIQGDNANAQSISSLNTRMTDAETGINTGSQARNALSTRVTKAEDTILTTSRDVTELESQLKTTGDTLTATASSLADTITVVSENKESATSSINRLESSVGDSEVLQRIRDAGLDTVSEAVQQFSIATVETERTTRTTEDMVLASKIETVEAALGDEKTGLIGRAATLETQTATLRNDPTTGVIALARNVENLDIVVTSNLSTISTLREAVADNKSATASEIGRVESSLGDAEQLQKIRDAGATAVDEAIQQFSSALVLTEATTRATETTALAERTTALEATVGDEKTGIVARAAALETWRTEVETEEASGLTALASKVSGIESTIDNPKTGLKARAAALETFETSAGKYLSANYALQTVKDTGDHRRVIGMRILNEDGTETTEGTIIFNTDAFLIAPPYSADRNDAGQAVFSVGTVKGNRRIVLNAATSIADASIDSAHISTLKADQITVTGTRYSTIANALIGNSDIVNSMIDGGSITGAKIAGGTITGANIKGGTITAAQIADSIQSTNYKENSAGWQINKNGIARFNNVYARGNIEATSIQANRAIVDTLNIHGNAVTVPQSTQAGSNFPSFGYLPYTPFGSLTEVMRITVNWDGNRPSRALVMGFATFIAQPAHNPNNAVTFGLTVRCTTANQSSHASFIRLVQASSGQMATQLLLTNPSNSSDTFVLYSTCDSSLSRYKIQARGITVIGLKR